MQSRQGLFSAITLTLVVLSRVVFAQEPPLALRQEVRQRTTDATPALPVSSAQQSDAPRLPLQLKLDPPQTSRSYDPPVTSPAPYRPVELTPRRTWYGWQTLVAVGASVPLVFLGDGKAVTWVGVGGTYLSPAMIHFAHGQADKAVESLGLLSGGFLLGGLGGAVLSCYVGACNQPTSSEPGYLIGFSLGALLGTGIALALDTAVLAWQEPERKTPRDSPARLVVLPQIAVEKERTTVGLTGVF